MPDINITDEELMRAILRLILSKWKYLVGIFIIFAVIFFGGGWYVYTDAKLKTSAMMISLYNDVTKAQDKAKELLEDTEFAYEEAQKKIDLINQKLSRAQDTLDENIHILNRTIEETVMQQQKIQRSLPQGPPEENEVIENPKPLLPPQLKKYKG